MRLTAPQRNALGSSQFGLPAQRAYPMPNVSHAVNAKARATQQLAAHHLSPAQHAEIDAKANRIIGALQGHR